MEPERLDAAEADPHLRPHTSLQSWDQQSSQDHQRSHCCIYPTSVYPGKGKHHHPSWLLA